MVGITRDKGGTQTRGFHRLSFYNIFLSSRIQSKLNKVYFKNVYFLSKVCAVVKVSVILYLKFFFPSAILKELMSHILVLLLKNPKTDIVKLNNQE